VLYGVMDKEFYDKCSRILGIPHEYKKPYLKKTRWNARVNGNGRFPGFGLVRKHSDDSFIVVSRKGTKLLTSEQEVYEYIGV